MLWKTLCNKIGKQPIQFTEHNHVTALINTPDGLKETRLNLKYNAKGQPYLI